MINGQFGEKKTSYGYNLLAVLITIAVGALGLVLWFAIREVIMSLLMYYAVNPFSWRAIDNFSAIGLGMLWLVVVLVSPYYFLKGRPGIGFWKNVSLVIGVLLLLLFLCHLSPWLLNIEANKVYLLQTLLEGAAGMLLIGVRRIRGNG